MMIDVVREMLPIPSPVGGPPLTVKELSQTFVVNAQNIHDYLAKDDGQSLQSNESFPFTTPPFPNTWLEWREVTPFKTGILCRCQDLHALTPAQMFSVRRAAYISSNTRWVACNSIFVGDNHQTLYLGDLIWHISEEGLLQFSSEGNAFACVTPLKEELAKKNFPDSSVALSKVVWFAFNLMNCKNVETIKGPEIPSALQKARQRRGKHPLFRYHTILIDGHQKKIITTGGGVDADEEGNSKALHICRGHFKTFSEAGLFGKYRGRYWWSMHRRGDAHQGVVGKDYNVQP